MSYLLVALGGALGSVLRYFLSLVEGRAPKRAVLTGRDARNSIALVLAERKSAETGKAVRVR